MSRKEVPRPGLVKAALAGKITNQEGARALRLSVRQFPSTGAGGNGRRRWASSSSSMPARLPGSRTAAPRPRCTASSTMRRRSRWPYGFGRPRICTAISPCWGKPAGPTAAPSPCTGTGPVCFSATTPTGASRGGIFIGQRHCLAAGRHGRPLRRRKLTRARRPRWRATRRRWRNAAPPPGSRRARVRSSGRSRLRRDAPRAGRRPVR